MKHILMLISFALAASLPRAHAADAMKPAMPGVGDPALPLTGMSPRLRVQKAVEYGAQIHPQYATEFENGISVAWHRAPGAMGCAAAWDSQLQAAHYDNLAQIDGRIGLAGDHLSRGLTGWQEGAVLSSLDAITRLHKRIVNS